MSRLFAPLAAPETPQLRHLRFAMMGLCFATAGAVLATPWLAVMHPRAVLLIPILLLSAIAVSLRYWRQKSAADVAYALQVLEAARAGELSGERP